MATAPTATGATNATGASRPARRSQGEQTKQAILQAAIELYAASGSRGTGLMAIGERAGVAHATVLYHFGSSHDLLMAVLHERERRFQDATRHAWAEPGLAVFRHLGEIARFQQAEPQLAKLFAVLQAENLDATHPAHAFFRQRRRDVRDLLRANLSLAVERGQVRPDVDVSRKVDEVLAFTTGAQIQHWLAPDEVDLVELYDGYVASLLADLGAARAG
jgi:AcrR family transcriptional regulator